MMTLYKKEISIFFSTISGPLIISLFLLINSILLWSNLSQFNILDNAYASMDTFFAVSPLFFLLFIPAISMRTFSDEYKSGTIEILLTRPISIYQIIVSKFLALLTLVIISLILTFPYVLSIYFLGETEGNLDLGIISGSYVGLLMLSCVFISISICASSLSNNQILAFIFGIIISTIFYFGFDFLGAIQIFQPIDIVLQKIGIDYHYQSMSQGLFLISDIVYFISLSFLFLKFTEIILQNKRK